MEAANSFDPSRGVLFKTFAYYRIRGAIYDSLRKMGWFAKESPRLRFESGANEYMKDHADAAPPGGSPEESLQELKEITTAVVSCYFLSLSSVEEQIPEKGKQSPEEEYLENEEKHEPSAGDDPAAGEESGSARGILFSGRNPGGDR